MRGNAVFVALVAQLGFFGSTKAEVVTRYDVNDIWKPHELTQTQIDVPDQGLPSRKQGLVNGTVAANPFNFYYSCTSSTLICQRVQSAFESAGQKLAQALRIRTPIDVQVKFYSFCTGVAAPCALSNTLGKAGPSAYFSAKLDPNAPSFLYPQALVKQYQPDKRLIYSSYDIVAEFNSDFNFWYPANSFPIESSQYDFEYVILHELTHGLGFISGWTYWYDLYSNFGAFNSFLAPNYGLLGNKYYFRQLNSFDAYIIGFDGVKMTDLANEIYSYPAQSTFTQFLSSFQVAGFRPFAAAQMAYLNAISRNLKFRINEALSFFLYSPISFSSGSSMSHFDYDKYQNTADFLMTNAFGIWRGSTLASILALFPQVVGAYGPLTMHAMKGIGWEWNNGTGYDIMYINVDFVGVYTSPTYTLTAQMTTAFTVCYTVVPTPTPEIQFTPTPVPVSPSNQTNSSMSAVPTSTAPPLPTTNNGPTPTPYTTCTVSLVQFPTNTRGSGFATVTPTPRPTSSSAQALSVASSILISLLLLQALDLLF